MFFTSVQSAPMHLRRENRRGFIQMQTSISLIAHFGAKLLGFVLEFKPGHK